MTDSLPRGIYFEQERKRYRVRLYRRSHVVWRSYHFNLCEAIEALSSALEAQSSWQPSVEIKKPSLVPQTILDLFK